ncbi:MAG: hypothetical protein GWQ05_01540 [Verrucomicrobiaceae bacterium]|nr:hypothetical protein [Verrucomicrobiales bacterium]MDC0502645.1 hypothetical protein [Verrucomicrobiales bacterium]NCF84680.1 hypothetical protein [Verrucomicrobiaceae bacterium]NCF89631.1 hypothetical protein [Verrucomicrobiaceae bacterium]
MKPRPLHPTLGPDQMATPSPATPAPSKSQSRGILTLVFIWLASVLAAVACFYFLPAAGSSQSSATYGLNRAIPILGLVLFALIDSLVVLVKTFRKRKALTPSIRSLGYSPFFFTTGSLATLLQRILSE